MWTIAAGMPTANRTFRAWETAAWDGGWWRCVSTHTTDHARQATVSKNAHRTSTPHGDHSRRGATVPSARLRRAASRRSTAPASPPTARAATATANSTSSERVIALPTPVGTRPPHPTIKAAASP